MQDVSIYSEFITLGQLLKLTGIVSAGSEVKEMLAEGGFLVNGEDENRRGKKLYPDDVITFPDGSQARITT